MAEPELTLPSGVTATRHRDSASEANGKLFRRLPKSQTGIDFVNRIDDDHPLSRLYISGFASGGIAIGDVDGDGLADVYLTNGPDDNKLYRQVENLRFEDITARAGVAASGNWSAGAAFADVDSDGDLDLYVCNYDQPNGLFINAGDGTFVDRAKESNVGLADASVMSYFHDYDNDGDLDCYVLTNRLYRAGGAPKGKVSETVNGQVQLLPEYARYYDLISLGGNRFTAKTSGRPNQLFQNDGTGKFTNVTETAGVGHAGKGLSAIWYDFDQDGLPDIYVANDFDDPDHLYHNNGDGTFTDVITDVVPHTTWFSMGSDSADLNNDGMMDLVVLDMSATSHYRQKVTMGDMSRRQDFMDHSNPRQLMRNTVFLNSGVGRFMESAHLSGLSSSDWSWAVKLADFDNDSRCDVFVTNGMTRDLTNADKGINQSTIAAQEEWQLVKSDPPQKDRNLAFRNRGGVRFEQVNQDWGLDHLGMSYAAAYGDLDGDGDLDIITTNLDEQVHVYENTSSNQSRITVQLLGSQSNRQGIGATIRVRQGEESQVRVLNPMSGFMSSNEAIAHFGLGESRQIDELIVEWPNGTVQSISDLPVGYQYRIEENGNPTTNAPHKSDGASLFVAASELSPLTHKEIPFDDFEKQPLLPNKLSQLGPGLAVADIDGDGREDFFVGAAKGSTGEVLLRKIGGADAQPLPDDLGADHEDFASLFFDADRDGDLDLYVVSGGVEAEEDLELLRDRLYLNDGAGNLSEAPSDAINAGNVSGSVVAAADFDRDGDLDLFVGGRVIPGAYPTSPPSQLLLNETKVAGQPRFQDMTKDVAPEMSFVGMVTSAIWSDIDNDGWLDLLVTTEWGPIEVFRNESGKLVRATESSGLGELLGWWNGIAGRDLDNDGDIDFVATNFGLNTKYHPSPGHPSRIYFGTFGNETEPHIVEAKVGDKTILPVRGKSCSQNAMPFVREKFGTYHDFALATLTDIYSDQGLAKSEMFEANTLESSVLWNDGQGKFEVAPLPTLAQISPAFGVVATEVNGDGVADIYLVQNFYHPQRETGKMAGGMSALYLGDGARGFTEVWPKQSGLAVGMDAKGLGTCDLNDDGWVDFAITTNDGPTLAFENNGARANEGARSMRVRLVGVDGNPTAVGARIRLELSDGSQQVDEVRAGGSYLSQSTSDLFFGLGNDASVKRLLVRWPDGTEEEFVPGGDRIVEDDGNFVIHQGTAK